MEPLDRKFAKTLYHLVRNERRVKQADIIEKTGIPQSTVSAIMNMKRGCDHARRELIASCFDMTLEEFLSYLDKNPEEASAGHNPDETLLVKEDINHYSLSSTENQRRMNSPEETHKRFFQALSKKQKEFGRGFNKFLHHETELSTSYLSLLLNGSKRASQETQMKICSALNIDYQSLFFDNKIDSAPQQNGKIVRFQSETEKEHFKVIRKFKDPDTALLFNSFLARLEDLDVQKYEEIFGQVRGIVRKLEETPEEEKFRKAASDEA